MSPAELYFSYSFHVLGRSLAISSSQKPVKFSTCIFSSSSYQNNGLSWCILIPRASRLPSFFPVIACTIDIILQDNTNVLQIWSMLASCQELLNLLNHWMMQFWSTIPCSPNMVTVCVCSKLKTSWKTVVFPNEVRKDSRHFVGIFNKTVVPLALVEHQMIIAHLYPTRTRGIK